jgi:outer membrane protein assembly factor BamD
VYLPLPMRRILLHFSLTLALAAALPACATKHTTMAGSLRLGANAEQNYQYGVDELNAKNYAEAVRFFEHVKAKYPFSKVSVACDLRLADVKFAQGRWLEAADAYEAFVKDHPSAEELDFAEFRAGVSHLKASPQDFFLLPPVQEKDQSETEKGAVALRTFLQKRPTSKYLPEAQKALAQAEGLLAKREMYAGDYYFKRELWAGAAGRYRGLTETYPSAPQVEPALLKLAQSYSHLGEKFQARQALQKLITQYPDGRDRRGAEKLLESLR